MVFVSGAVPSPRRYGRITGEAIAEGQMVAVDPSSGLAMIANAITGGTQQAPCFGIAFVGEALGDMLEIKCSGIVEGAAGLTPGAPVYLAETDGAVTASAPTTSGDIVQCVGIAIDADTFVLDVDPLYTTVP